ncbi:MAG: thiamine diphosphokinase [Clostridiales bacterium]|nr:thiamine diphosphokinase [Clostridiales bacterium]
MRGVLLLNGEPYLGDINTIDAVVYCCDGAYSWAKDKVKIDKNVGDFDSLSITPYPAPEEIYPTEKDLTDGEIAIDKMIASGINDIEIYGAFGKRSDHFLGNIHLLLRAKKGGARAKLISQTEIIFLAEEVAKLNGLKGKTVSVLPFGGELHIIGSKGLKFSYPKKLCYGECRGISNVVLQNEAFIELEKGSLALIIINRGSV